MSVPAAYIGVILIWSTTPLAIQWSSEGWGYLIGVTGRMLLGAVLCFTLVKLMKSELPWHRQALRTYLAAGAGVYGAMMSTYWGAQFVPSGLVAVIFGLSPIMTAFVATLVLKEQGFTPGKVLAMLLGLMGLVIIYKSDITQSTLAWKGIAALLFATLLHSTSGVLVKKIAAELPALTVTCGALIIASPTYLVTWWLVDGVVPSHASLRASLAIVYLGVFGSMIGFTLFFYVLKRMEANRVSLITVITPVIALLIGQSINHEVISLNIWLGTGCIISALVMHQWADSFIRRLRYAWLKVLS